MTQSAKCWLLISARVVISGLWDQGSPLSARSAWESLLPSPSAPHPSHPTGEQALSLFRCPYLWEMTFGELSDPNFPPRRGSPIRQQFHLLKSWCPEASDLCLLLLSCYFFPLIYWAKQNQQTKTSPYWLLTLNMSSSEVPRKGGGRLITNI